MKSGEAFPMAGNNTTSTIDDNDAWSTLINDVPPPNKASVDDYDQKSKLESAEEIFDPYSYYTSNDIPKNPDGDLMLDPRVTQLPHSPENLKVLRSYIITTKNDAQYLRRFKYENINLDLLKRCLQIDAYHLLARQHMLEENPRSNIINVTSLSGQDNKSEKLSTLLSYTQQSIRSKSDLVKGLVKLDEHGRLDDLSDTERGRLDEFKAITSFDALLQKIRGKQFGVIADSKQCIIPVESIFKFLSLPLDQPTEICSKDLDGKIGQLSKTEFAFVAAEYLKQNNILGNYVLPDNIEQHAKYLMGGKYIDFSATNQLTETADTLYTKVKLNPDLKAAILERMPENLSKLKKAIYIYIKMCLILSYDNKVKAENQVGEATKRHRNLDYVELISPKNNEVVCFEFNIIFAKLLHELGLHFKSEYPHVIGERYGDSHVYLKFRDGKFIVKADAVKAIFDGDLIRAKLGLDLKGLECTSSHPLTQSEFQKSVKEIYKLVMQQEQDKFPWQEYGSLTKNLSPIDFSKRKTILIEILKSTKLRGIDAIAYAAKLRKILFSEQEQEDNVFVTILRNNEVPDQEFKLEAGAVIAINEAGFKKQPNETDYYYLSSNRSLTPLTKEEIEDKLNREIFEYIKSGDPRIPGINSIFL